MKRNLPFIPSRAPGGGLFVGFSASPASGIVAGYAAVVIAGFYILVLMVEQNNTVSLYLETQI